MKMSEPMVQPGLVRADTDRIVADLRMLAADAEHLLKATTSQTGQHVAAARARVDESLAAAKVHMGNAGRVAVERTHAAARATDGYVHANPWQVMAVGVVAGFLVGALLARGGARDA